jgi:hypothetical protein
MNQKEYRELISSEDARLIISKISLKTEIIEMQIKEYQGEKTDRLFYQPKAGSMQVLFQRSQ